MACLEMRKESKWWYGRWTIKGKTYVKNLGIIISGTRPKSVNQESDRRFEQSRAKAQARLEDLIRQSTDNRRQEELIQTVHEIRTGRRIGSLSISKAYDAWEKLPRRKTPGQTYMDWGKGVFSRLDNFLKEKYPTVTEMGHITVEMASEFMRAETLRNVSARTYNAELSLLKGAFKGLRREAGIAENPFEGIVTKDENTIHRKPFNPKELKAILDAASTDDFCRPLIITGMCTAMRRGDVCLLKWADVDMKGRFIKVKTGKTGVGVHIPMFPMLYDELSSIKRSASEYCFPEQAQMYQTNPDGVNLRLMKVFEAAGFIDAEDIDDTKAVANIDSLSPEDKCRIGMEKISKLTEKDFSQKVRETMGKILRSYLDGMTVNNIAQSLALSKGAVSTYLHRVEKVTGLSIVRRTVKSQPALIRGSMHVKQEHGLRRVNQRGFHAFRATWVTLALTAGVPIELVRRVTGHTTVETVLGHYFQPGREQFRQAIQAAMPKLLTNGTPSRDEQMLEILRKTSAKTWAHDSKRLLELLEPAKP